jgi:endonuclease/exonuclease/phosphatase family metal-dependent hydrolase
MNALAVMTYNIRSGGIGREAAIVEVIRGAAPDVVLLQEATRPEVVERLARDGGYPHFGARAGYSTAYLSSLPVSHESWQRPRGAKHPYLELAVEGFDVHLVALHLSAWFSNWTERRRAFEIRALLAGIRGHQSGFHLIVGDFNALAPGERLELRRMPAWIRAMIWLSGNDIARATIQTMLDADYLDVWRTGHADDAGYTFPTWDPHLRLDYAFVPARDAARVATCRIVSESRAAAAASDHFPLLVAITGSDRQ